MPQFVDKTEREALTEVLKDGGVFLDIGANAGLYSLWVASRRNDRVVVHAFEPDRDLCEMLRFNLETNGIANVQVHQVAIGDSAGSVRLVSGHGNKGENFISENTAEAGLEVPMTTLPHFLANHDVGALTALKIDIEGHEYAALDPLFKECPESVWPRLLICEVVHDESHELARLLATHGYRRTASGRLNGIYQRPR